MSFRFQETAPNLERESLGYSGPLASLRSVECPHPLWANSDAGGSLSISNHWASSTLGVFLMFIDNGNDRKSKIKCQLLLFPTKDSTWGSFKVEGSIPTWSRNILLAPSFGCSTCFRSSLGGNQPLWPSDISRIFHE